MKTRHYFEKRNQREELISKIGNGTAIEFFYVDRKHRDDEIDCQTKSDKTIL